MSRENNNRRIRKNARRGRVAQPDLIFQRDEWIPGVPAFQGGGTINPYGGVGTEPYGPASPPNPYGGVGTEPYGPPSPPPPPRQTIEDYALAHDWVPIGPGEWWEPAHDGLPGRHIDLRSPAPGGTSAGFAGPTPEEIALQREALRIQQEQNDLVRRGQDLDREKANLDRELERAIAAQDIELRRQIEARMAANAQEQARLERDRLSLDQLRTQIEARLGVLRLASEQRGQDVTMRGQDINAQLGLLQARIQDLDSQRQDAIARGQLGLARDIEMRMRAEMQQAATLQQHQAALGAAGLGIEAQQGAGSLMAQLAGPMAALQANPRNFMELQFAYGGGQNFLNQLMAGQPISPQSAANAGQMSGWRGAGDVMSTFQEAMQAARLLSQMGQNVPQAPNLQDLLGLGQLPPMAPMPAPIPTPSFELPTPAPVEPVALPAMAGGGRMVTNEPIVGMGLLSGRPRFTVGEPTTRHPQGAPEMLQVVPMQEGGIIGAGKWWDKPGMAPALPVPEAVRPAAPMQPAAPAAPAGVQVVINPAGGAANQPVAATAPAPEPAPVAAGGPAPRWEYPPETDFITGIFSRWPNVTEVDAQLALQRGFPEIADIIMRFAAGLLTADQAYQLMWERMAAGTPPPPMGEGPGLPVETTPPPRGPLRPMPGPFQVGPPIKVGGPGDPRGQPQQPIFTRGPQGPPQDWPLPGGPPPSPPPTVPGTVDQEEAWAQTHRWTEPTYEEELAKRLREFRERWGREPTLQDLQALIRMITLDYGRMLPRGAERASDAIMRALRKIRNNVGGGPLSAQEMAELSAISPTLATLVSKFGRAALDTAFMTAPGSPGGMVPTVPGLRGEPFQVPWPTPQTAAAGPGPRGGTALPAPAQTAGSQGEFNFLRSLMAGLYPRAYYGLLPTQAQGGWLDSIISAMGVPPEDFWESLFRTWPSGPDPSRLMYGNFERGGLIRTR